MNLLELGYNNFFEQQRIEQNLTEFAVARVVIENKERYVIISESGELEGQITGKLRFGATSREEFPAVGDWVAISEFADNQAVIHNVLKRNSYIARKAVDCNDLQIIAANIDYAFITTSVVNDFNLNRIERYLTITNTGNIKPIILLTKTDLISKSELIEKIEILRKHYKNIPIYDLSSITNNGFEDFTAMLEQGKTYCFVGSSGVGKSTIINKLLGVEQLKINQISTSTNKGKHTTTHRELIVLEQKCILIDTPGMREIGITNDKTGLEHTFSDIAEIAKNCKFKDCTHTNEIGCAVKLALENGEIDNRTFANYQKLEKERIHLETTYEQKRKNDKKFGKMCKQIMNEKRKTKKF